VESIDAVKSFAGENCEQAVVEPIVGELLTRFDQHVAHFTLALAAHAQDSFSESTG
jgi:hypothetical protein